MENKKLLTLLILVLITCGCSSMPLNNNQKIKNQNFVYNEAPMLTEFVKKNELPSVDKRLPDNPMLVQPVETVGKYGGTWHIGQRSKGDYNSFTRHIGYENLVRWDESWTKVIPNVAQRFEINDDATVFTFYLRKGMKWSDGEAFNSDDVVFWYEDVFMNKELTPVHPDWFMSGGKPLSVEKIDDYTFKIKFEEPYGLFPQVLAKVRGADPVTYPSHYLKQFHEKYNSNIQQLIDENEEEINEVILAEKEAGNQIEPWAALFISKFGKPGNIDHPTRWVHPEVPVLHAWVLKGVYGKDNEILAERNPYYWKIDSLGNQLPYIDFVHYYVKKTTEELVDLATEGELDMQIRKIATTDNKEALEAGKSTGEYTFFDTIISNNNMATVRFNLNHKDPVKREIFLKKDFRVGVSHAINREEIIQKVHKGEGKPFQVAPIPESPLYDEELAKQFTEYDVDKANEYLDKAGLDKKDSEGFRIGPDGKRVAFTILTAQEQPDDTEAAEIIGRNLQAVGLDAKAEKLDRTTLFKVAKEDNDFDVWMWNGEGGLDVILQANSYFEINPGAALYWANWYMDPSSTLSEEPPEYVKEQFQIWDQIKATGDQEQQQKLMKQILDISKEKFHIIGTVLPGTGYGIRKHNFRNVPKLMIHSWTYPTPAPTNPCQYFIEDGQ